MLFDLYGTLVDIALDETTPRFWGRLAETLFRRRAGLTGEQLQLRYRRFCRAEAMRRGTGHTLDTVFQQLLLRVGRPAARCDVERVGELFRGVANADVASEAVRSTASRA